MSIKILETQFDQLSNILTKHDADTISNNIVPNPKGQIHAIVLSSGEVESKEEPTKDYAEEDDNKKPITVEIDPSEAE